MDHPSLQLHLVTDTALCVHHALEEVVRAAVQGGVTCVQLREKNLATAEFVARARALKTLLTETPTPVPLIINDRLDVALACEAEGVHVGQTDMPVAVIRRYLPQAIIGLSVETLAQAQALPEGVDYLGVSPVFATATKGDAAPALGLEGLAAIRAVTTLPLVAIGGIHTGNAAQVLAAGANGLAVVSAICSARDPRQAAQALRTILRHHAVSGGGAS